MPIKRVSADTEPWRGTTQFQLPLLNEKIIKGILDGREILPIRAHHGKSLFEDDYLGLYLVANIDNPILQLDKNTSVAWIKKSLKDLYFARKLVNDVEYIIDIFGSASPTEDDFIKISQDTFTNYYFPLTQLSIEDYLYFGFTLDGKCNSCVIGEHCRRIFRQGSLGTISLSEKDAFNDLRDKLRDSNYQEGIDYFFGAPRGLLLPFNPSDIDNRDGALLVQANIVKQLAKTRIAEVESNGQLPKFCN